MVPDDIECKKIVIGPPEGTSILDDDSPLPVEAVVTENGYYIRVMLEGGDLGDLMARPYLWLIIQSTQVPVFAMVTEKKAVR